MAKTKRCSDAVRAGRLEKAKQFRMAAEIVDEYAAGDVALIDAYVTLCVQAGIAAADAICCVRLGEHAQGDDHREAIALVEKVDKQHGRDLAVLLAMKNRTEYGESPASAKDRKQAMRAMARLVDASVG